MKVFTQKELNQIEKSTQLIFNAIKANKQDLTLVLHTLKIAQNKLEKSVFSQTPLVMPTVKEKQKNKSDF